MQNFAIALLSLTFMFAACNAESESEQNNLVEEIPPAKSTAPVNGLFIFKESYKPGVYKTVEIVEGAASLTGAMILTEKGNIILHLLDEPSDTQRYFWGEYSLTDSTLTYNLTSEYYYFGKWDARLDGPNPDFLKGKSRTFSSGNVVLERSESDSLAFFVQLTLAEQNIGATTNYTSVRPQGIEFRPYYEKPNEKFVGYVIKQIPVLANL